MRIFVDCSHIDFGRQPTGIPRVVMQYVEQGYRWSEASGIETIPVVTTAAGLLPVRPVPGARRPGYLARWEEGAAETVEVEVLLERSAHHLQCALVACELQPSPARAAAAVRQAFRGLLAEAEAAPFDIAPGDVLFCPAYWHDVPPAHFRALQRRGCRIATLVHDILPVTHAKFYKAPWKHEFAANLLSAMRHSDALFAVSAYTADSMRELAERNGLQDLRVDVLHNGFQPLVSAAMRERMAAHDFRPALRDPARYAMIRDSRPFLMVGTVEPKKGHIPTIRAFEALWDAGLSRPLVIAGRKGWLEESVVHAITGSRHFGERLFWFEDFDDLDLAFAYHHARGLVFASYAEGFGIPMVEALSAGRPVIAYDTPVNREVLGEHGLIYGDFPTFARHVARLDDDAGFADACAAVAGFRWPDWETVASGLFDTLAGRFGRPAP